MSGIIGILKDEWSKEAFVDGPLLHLLEQHRRFKAILEKRKRGLKIAAWTILAIYALWALVMFGAFFVVGTHNSEAFDFLVGLFTCLALVFSVLFLLSEYVFIDRQQERYERGLAESRPGLNLDDEASIQGYIWEFGGAPATLLPRLYGRLVWKSRIAREQGADAPASASAMALSATEQLVLDVWSLDDINAEAIEIEAPTYPDKSLETLQRGIEAYRTIGAHKAADIWTRAFPLLKKLSVHAHPSDPSEQLMDWEEAELYDQLSDLNEQLYECEDETHALLYEYVLQHKTELTQGGRFCQEENHEGG